MSAVTLHAANVLLSLPFITEPVSRVQQTCGIFHVLIHQVVVLLKHYVGTEQKLHAVFHVIIKTFSSLLIVNYIV